MASYSCAAYGILLTDEFGNISRKTPEPVKVLTKILNYRVDAEYREDTDEVPVPEIPSDLAWLRKAPRADVVSYASSVDGNVIVFGFDLYEETMGKMEEVSSWRPRFDALFSRLPEELRTLLEGKRVGVHLLTGRS
jgi:hypothetical protein